MNCERAYEALLARHLGKPKAMNHKRMREYATPAFAEFCQKFRNTHEIAQFWNCNLKTAYSRMDHLLKKGLYERTKGKFLIRVKQS